MKTRIAPYKRKSDGSWMLYVNNYERNVSLGIAERVYTSKLTKGQSNLLNSFLKSIENAEPLCDFKPIKEHKEPKASLDFGIEIYITDIAEVCGINTGEDGLFLSYNGKLYNSTSINQSLNEIV